MDPEDPLPYTGEGILLDDLPAGGDRPDGRRPSSGRRCSTSRSATSAARPPADHADHGVLDAIDQPFVCFTFGLGFDAAMLEAVDAHVRRLLEGLAPWDSGRRYLNFAESPMDPRSIYPVEGYDRLVAAKARYDPTGVFLANHPVTPQ